MIVSEVARVIGSVPGLAEKSYLELGTAFGATFNAISAREKVGVDVSPSCSGIFCGTTDSFFAGLDPGRRFDVIYIDASHHYPDVLSDYNHAVQHLAEDGYLFLHDLYPPHQGYTSFDLCGDAYMLLAYLLTLSRAFKMYVTDPKELGGYGLTLIRYPLPIDPPREAGSVGYEEFIERMKGERLWTFADLIGELGRTM